MTFEQGTQRTFYDAARETRKAEVKKSESVFMNEFVAMLKSGVSVRQRDGEGEDDVKIRLFQPPTPLKGAPAKSLVIEWVLEATEAHIGTIALSDIVVIAATAADASDSGGCAPVSPRGDARLFWSDGALETLLVGTTTRTSRLRSSRARAPPSSSTATTRTSTRCLSTASACSSRT